MRHTARMLVGLFVVAAGLVAKAQAAPPTLAEVVGWATTDRAKAERAVFLGCQLSDAELIEVTTNLASSGHPGVFLIDSVAQAESLRNFLREFAPSAVVPIGRPAGNLDRRLRIESSPSVEGHDVASSLFPDLNPRQVVLAPHGQRDQILRAAFLAGTLKAPFRIVPWDEVEKAQRVGGAAAAEAPRDRATPASVRTLVVANAQDAADGTASMSALAPWLAVQKRGLLLLTNQAGTNVAELVQGAAGRPEARQADSLLLLGNAKALPTLRRANPLDGKDEFIEMEPLTPSGHEPLSFATGRLFHDDLAVVTLMLARPRLWRKKETPKAVIVSNPGGGLPFLETFSRNTAQELKNAGYEVTAFFNQDANRPAVREALPGATIFLWEGHHGTLVRDYEAQRWTEPLRPSLVFLQSCLALAEDKAQPFLERGAVGVIGSTSRNYSGSGGALSLAYVDALVYDQQTVGGSLRSAKNFLLAFAQLKEKRFGADAKMNGASLRSAWSFSLWGDPTVELPRPLRSESALSAIRHRVKSNSIIITLPEDAHDKVITARYQTQMLPNARLAGLISKKDDPDGHPLVPLIFQEVHFPKAPEGKTPKLRTRLPDANWVFTWDARRATGYLLIRPRAKDTAEIRFQVAWE